MPGGLGRQPRRRHLRRLTDRRVEPPLPTVEVDPPAGEPPELPGPEVQHVMHGRSLARRPAACTTETRDQCPAGGADPDLGPHLRQPRSRSRPSAAAECGFGVTWWHRSRIQVTPWTRRPPRGARWSARGRGRRAGGDRGRIRAHRDGLDQGGARDPARAGRATTCSRPWRTSTTSPPGWPRPTAIPRSSAACSPTTAARWTGRGARCGASTCRSGRTRRCCSRSVPPNAGGPPYRDTIHELTLPPLPDPAVDGQVLADMAHFGRVLTTRSFGAPYAEQTPGELIDSYLRHNRESSSHARRPSARLRRHRGLGATVRLPRGCRVPDRPVPSFNDRQAFRELFGLDRTPEPVQYSKGAGGGALPQWHSPTPEPTEAGPGDGAPQTTESGSSVWPVGPIWISVPISGHTPQS